MPSKHSKFDYTLINLDSIILRDEAKLISEYKDNEITSTTLIQFSCHCGKESEKIYRSIVRYIGAFCSKCINERKERSSYTQELLKTFIERDNASLVTDLSKCKLTCESMLEFLCGKCHKQDSKKFKAIVKGSGLFCSSCIKQEVFHTNKIYTTKEENKDEKDIEKIKNSNGYKKICNIVESNTSSLTNPYINDLSQYINSIQKLLKYISINDCIDILYMIDKKLPIIDTINKQNINTVESLTSLPKLEISTKLETNNIKRKVKKPIINN